MLTYRVTQLIKWSGKISHPNTRTLFYLQVFNRPKTSFPKHLRAETISQWLYPGYAIQKHKTRVAAHRSNQKLDTSVELSLEVIWYRLGMGPNIISPAGHIWATGQSLVPQLDDFKSGERISAVTGRHGNRDKQSSGDNLATRNTHSRRKTKPRSQVGDWLLLSFSKRRCASIRKRQKWVLVRCLW